MPDGAGVVFYLCTLKQSETKLTPELFHDAREVLEKDNETWRFVVECVQVEELCVSVGRSRSLVRVGEAEQIRSFPPWLCSQCQALSL